MADHPVRKARHAREHPDEHERVAPPERPQPRGDRLRIVDVVGRDLVALEPPAEREHISRAGAAVHADVRDERDHHATERGAHTDGLPDAAEPVADRDQEHIVDDVIRQVVEPLAELGVLEAQPRELAIARIEDRVELEQHAGDRDRQVRAAAREQRGEQAHDDRHDGHVIRRERERLAREHARDPHREPPVDQRINRALERLVHAADQLPLGLIARGLVGDLDPREDIRALDPRTLGDGRTGRHELDRDRHRPRQLHRSRGDQRVGDARLRQLANPTLEHRQPAHNLDVAVSGALQICGGLHGVRKLPRTDQTIRRSDDQKKPGTTALTVTVASAFTSAGFLCATTTWLGNVIAL